MDRQERDKIRAQLGFKPASFSDKAAAISLCVAVVVWLLATIYIHWIAGIVLGLIAGGACYRAMIEMRAAENLADRRQG